MKRHMSTFAGAMIVMGLVAGIGLMLRGYDVVYDITMSPPNLIEAKLQLMSLRDQVASLFVVHTQTRDPEIMRQFVERVRPGGVILMGDNIPPDAAMLSAITGTIRGTTRYPRLVAIDQEGGTVSRLTDNQPAGITLASLPPSSTHDAFAVRSQMLRSSGITLNFGIVADTTNNPQSFIYRRVLGTTPTTASERVRQALLGSREQTLTTLKHYPGHGAVVDNSHYGIPSSEIGESQLQGGALLPFHSNFDLRPDMVMMGHLRFPTIDDAPASLSRVWHDKLAEDYRGITITDDMFMLGDSGEAAYTDPRQTAVMALQAGNTMLLYVTDNGGKTTIDPNELIDFVVARVNDGTLPRGLIEHNARKVLSLQMKSYSLQNN
ncbi:MAG: glycoside hydrolase family 3 N-terminal domain-containing protein [Candidatus Saccharimonadales bacterium]